MTFERFTQLRPQGKVSIGIDSKNAVKVAHLVPGCWVFQSLRWARRLTLLMAVVVFIFSNLYIALAMVLFLNPLLRIVVRRAAVDTVLNYAEDDEAFFNSLTEKGMLVFELHQ